MDPQPPNHEAEIASLELQLKEYEIFLTKSIENNEIFAKTKIILNEIKRISQKIIALKKLSGLT
ncbi:MAG TPA: hypothetical protein VFI33_05960 [Puia sp.]|nr:hypothetical protein [Puia sp.]